MAVASLLASQSVPMIPGFRAGVLAVPATCRHCGRRVPSGAVRYTGDSDTVAGVFCSAACIRAAQLRASRLDALAHELGVYRDAVGLACLVYSAQLGCHRVERLSGYADVADVLRRRFGLSV